MRNRILVAMLVGISLLSGCSFNASISRGDETGSVLVDRDDMRRVHNSTVRIKAYNEVNQLVWMGTGSVFKIENNRIHILSNNHVCNGAPKITVEPIINGKSMGEFKARVDLCVDDNNVDIGVVSLPQGKTLKDIEFVPIVNKKLKVGEEIYWVGCDGGEQQNGQIGRVLMVADDHIFMSPKAIGGDSGSSVVQFDEDGNPHVVGLIAWVTWHNGEAVAMAMPSDVVLDVLAGGKLPDLPNEGDVPPSNMETERLIQGLLERLRELREDNRRERQGLLDRIKELQMERAIEQQETQLFRDRFGKWQKDTDDHLDRIEDKEDGLTDKIMGQFTTLKQLINIAKWSFYALVAALLVSIFAGQGWMTRIIVTIFKVIYHIIRGTFAIVADAIAKPIKKTESPSEALDNLREEIEDAFEDDSSG